MNYFLFFSDYRSKTQLLGSRTSFLRQVHRDVRLRRRAGGRGGGGGVGGEAELLGGSLRQGEVVRQEVAVALLQLPRMIG